MESSPDSPKIASKTPFLVLAGILLILTIIAVLQTQNPGVFGLLPFFTKGNANSPKDYVKAKTVLFSEDGVSFKYPESFRENNSNASGKKLVCDTDYCIGVKHIPQEKAGLGIASLRQKYESGDKSITKLTVAGIESWSTTEISSDSQLLQYTLIPYSQESVLYIDIYPKAGANKKKDRVVVDEETQIRDIMLGTLTLSR